MTAKTAAKGEFTPGPWKGRLKPVFIKQVDGPALHFGEYSLNLWGIAGRSTSPKESPTLSRAEANANAALMEAAPQMYAKLLSIVRKIDDASGQPSFTAKETDELNELLEAIHG